MTRTPGFLVFSLLTRDEAQQAAQPVLGCNHCCQQPTVLPRNNHSCLECTMDSDTQKASLGEPGVSSKPAQNRLSHCSSQWDLTEIISGSTQDLFSWAHNPGIATQLVLIRALYCQRGSSCLKPAQRRKRKALVSRALKAWVGGGEGEFSLLARLSQPVPSEAWRAQTGTYNPSQPSDNLTYFMLSLTQSLQSCVYSNYAFVLKMGTKYQNSMWPMSQKQQQRSGFCISPRPWT